ncbi:MAG: ABC transporter permease [Bacillota bacterium]|nr:ABC transporter permease [Bacillota bacterium]
MSEKLKSTIKNIGIPRFVIVTMLIVIYIAAYFLKLNVPRLLSDNLVRMGMNGVLVLAMVPGILSGTGLNFGLPLGIICGILGGLLSIELQMTGIVGFLVAMICSIPIAIIAGYFYGKLLNRVKGSEMMVGTYVGFSIVSLMCIAWLVMPFKSDAIRWPIGKGLRTTIALTDFYDKVLNDFLQFTIFGVTVPTGLLLFFFMMCLFVFLFLRTKTGMAIRATGSSNKFSKASGIDVDKSRMIATVLSTALGAIGILVYAQSYGFFQLYTAPLMMGFAAVAAILLGGASAHNAKITHVLLGVFVFQGLLLVALPVANVIFPQGNLSEVMRVIVQYGIILYALTKAGGGQ